MLKQIGLIITVGLCIGARAVVAPDESGLCLSAPELRKTYEFLHAEDELGLTIAKKFEVSKEVGAGCAGAFERFSKTYLLMKKSGVNLKDALRTGLIFAKENTERFKNFFEFFEMTYLKENFDFDFERSYEIAFKLSKDFAGSPTRARKDFEKAAEFCQKKSGLDLPIKKCAEIAVEVARASAHFQESSFLAFEQTFSFIRQSPQIEASMKEALEIALTVIKYGPVAPTNFKESFKFATDAGHGLGLKSSQALAFSLEQAKASNKSSLLPVYE